jgi:hypothetical protein
MKFYNADNKSVVGDIVRGLYYKAVKNDVETF